jgi:hypothetical protein
MSQSNRSAFALLLLIATATMGCEPAATELSLSAEPRAAGAAVWIEGEVSPEGEARVEIWAAELGALFGLSLHLRYPASEVELGEVELVELLGAEPDAHYIVTSRPGDLSLGGTRAAPSGGEVELSAPTRLAGVQLRWSAEESAVLALERQQVRRVDGSFVEARCSGAELQIGGAW